MVTIFHIFHKYFIPCTHSVPCQTLDDPDAPPFLEPVDPSTPQYFDMIQNPMDLGTVSKKLAAGAYAHPRDFLTDVQLVWFNCGAYNEGGGALARRVDCGNYCPSALLFLQFLQSCFFLHFCRSRRWLLQQLRALHSSLLYVAPSICG